jgi:alkaline phosphatase D
MSYGNLLDIYMLDINYLREVPPGSDDFTDPNRKILGDAQMDWFLNDLRNTSARWRIIGSQKQFGQWNLVGVPGSEGVPFYGGRAWDGFIADRNKVIKFLRDNGKNNNIFITGDNHMTFLMDIVENPFDFTQYNPNGSSKTVGVEFQPASISRGNFDETLRGILPMNAIRQLENASKALNRHHIHVDFVDHGYGLLDIRKERAVGEVYNIPILEVSTNEWLDVALETRDKANRWRRAFIREPSIPLVSSSELAPEEGQIVTAITPIRQKHLNAKVFPNPVNDILQIRATLPEAGNVEIEVFDIDGKRLHGENAVANDTNFSYTLNISAFKGSGKAVLLRITSGGREYMARLVLM